MVKVYIITGVRPYRQALEQALGATGRLIVVGGTEHPAEASLELSLLMPEVVLLDHPGPDGPVWASELRSMTPGVRVIVFGLEEAEHEVIAWAEAGVAGYVGREADLAEVVGAIEGVMRGEAACRPQTASILLKRIAAGPERSASTWRPDRHLTAREREILHLVGQGLSNQQIARRLFIALPTVKNHVHNILEKLEVSRRNDAVREIRRGAFVLHGLEGPEAQPSREPSAVI